MLNMILTSAQSNSSNSILFIFTYSLIFLILIGIIFLIYYLIKKLIKYYKTGE